MIAVAIVGLGFGAVITIVRVERRAILHHQQAEYHRWMEDQSRTRAIHLESLARDPSRHRDLLEALSRTGTRWKERALEARLELMDDEDGNRSKRWYPEARDVATKLARAYQRGSEHHGRLKERYQGAAFNPWDSVASDSPEPK